MNREKIYNLSVKEEPSSDDVNELIGCIAEALTPIEVNDFETYHQEWDILRKNTDINGLIKNSITDTGLISDYIFPLAIMRWKVESNQVKKITKGNSMTVIHNFYGDFLRNTTAIGF